MNKVSLSDAATFSDARTDATALTVENYVGTDNILQNKEGKRNSSYVPSAGKTAAYEAGDILIANIRPYLKKIWFATNNGGSSADVSTIRVKPGFDPKFIYYNLLQDEFFDFAMKGAKGSKMPRLDKKQILNFPIQAPDINTQKSIARTLSLLDDKIAVNRQISARLEAMARDLYNYWFVQFEFPDANNRPYKTAGGVMVYNKELKREIPAGWDVGTLLDIAQYDNGLACQKYRPVSDGYLRVIKIKEMHDGFSGETERVRPDIPVKAVINNGDVLFSWSASLEVMVWSGGKGALNQHIFKVSSDEYPKYFFYYQLVNYLRHFQLMAENRKTTMGHITQDHLKQSRIVIPPVGLIRDLNAQISPVLSQKIALELEKQKLTEVRDWLLPMLLNGQIEVAPHSLATSIHDHETQEEPRSALTPVE